MLTKQQDNYILCMKNLPIARTEVIKALKSSDIGGDLPLDVLEQLADVSSVFELEKGDVLTEKGAEGHHAYIILSGSIEVQLTQDFHNPIGSRTLIAGSIIGETGILEAGRRTARTVSLEHTQLLCLRDDDLDAIFTKDPRAGYYFMRNLSVVLAKRLRTTNLAIRHSLYVG